MTIKFSRQKLAEPQEKKAKSGIVGGLLSRKHQKIGDTPSDVPTVTPPCTYSPSKHPPFPTSSLEVLVSSKRGARGKSVCKPFPPTFWDNADAAALKVHEALSVDDLNPLMSKSSGDVMSSHIQKLVQVCSIDVGCFFFFVLLLLREIFFFFSHMQALEESLFVSGKLLDLEKKVATVEPMIKSLSAENEMLKNKVAILTVEAENDKERVAALKKSLQVEKDFSKQKDKQIDDQLKKAGPDAI